MSTVSHHRNSEGEEVAIETIEGGDFKGQLLLVIYDDPPMRKAAPMLLDEGTQRWLREALSSLDEWSDV